MSLVETLATTEVVNLVEGAVPERRDEVRSLWGNYGAEVRVVPAKRGLKSTADRDGIAFDGKTMDVLWLIGFNSWSALECYCPQVMLLHSWEQSISEAMEVDEGLDEVERSYRERRATVRSLLESADGVDVRWPPDIPRPNADRNAYKGSQYKAAYDLALLAVAFLLLHEVRHVFLDAEGRRHDDRPEEEMDCDVWARGYMTAKLGAYGVKHGHTYAQALRKRSMVIATAALMIHDITPELARQGTKQYLRLRIG